MKFVLMLIAAVSIRVVFAQDNSYQEPDSTRTFIKASATPYYINALGFDTISPCLEGSAGSSNTHKVGCLRANEEFRCSSYVYLSQPKTQRTLQFCNVVNERINPNNENIYIAIRMFDEENKVHEGLPANTRLYADLKNRTPAGALNVEMAKGPSSTISRLMGSPYEEAGTDNMLLDYTYESMRDRKGQLRTSVTGARQTPTPNSPAPRVQANQTPPPRPPQTASPISQTANNSGVDRYIQSQLTCADESNFDKFLTEQGADLKRAAEIFNVPEAFLKCLIFKESKFSASARSATGASGLGQITSIATEEMRRIYRIGMNISDEEYRRIVREKDEVFLEIEAQRARGNHNPIDLKNRLRELTVKAERYKISRRWDEYSRYLNTRGIRGTPNGLLASRSNPSAAIGLSVMYMKIVQTLHGMESDDTHVTTDNFRRLLTEAGAYNAGNRPFHLAQQKCAEFVDEEVLHVKCIYDNLKKEKSETNSYIQTIENCITSDINNVSSGYGGDIAGTVIPDDRLSTNQTESICFTSAASIVRHPFSASFSCNDITKIKGLFARQPSGANTCRAPLPSDVSDNLKYITRVLNDRAGESSHLNPSLVHYLGRDVVCRNKNGNVTCRLGTCRNVEECKRSSGACPNGYSPVNGNYITVSNPNMYTDDCSSGNRQNASPPRGVN